MAFPTPSVLDNFNRSNEDPLSDGGKWSGPIFTGDDDMKLVSSVALQSGTASFGDGYRNDQNYGPIVDCYATVGTKPGTDGGLVLYYRITGEGGGSADGYGVDMYVQSGTDVLGLIRFDNDVSTVVGTIATVEFAAGDSFGVRCGGSFHLGYRKPSGGSWTYLGQLTDSTYSAAGKVGIGTEGTLTGTIDDFGAGTTSEDWWVFVASGTQASANNGTSLSPGLPSGWAEGDLLVLEFQNYGGTNARQPQKPSGWNSIGGDNGWNNAGRSGSCHAVYWKLAGASESAPTLTLSGTGVTGDTQIARVHGYRRFGSGTIEIDQTGSTSTNASADNVGPITGITPTAGALTLISCGKTNDWNGTATLTNWLLSAQSESTTGNDAGEALLYQLASSGSATGDLTVTDNGATASAGLGFGILFSFKTASSVLLVVNDLSFGFAVEGNLALTQANTLAVQDCAFSFPMEGNLALLQQNILAVQDALFALGFESPTLSAGFTLVVQDLLFSLLFDNIVLTQQNILVVQDASFGLTFENTALTQQNTLSVADLLFGLAFENVTLSIAVSLVVADALFALNFEQPALVQQHLLAVQDMLFGLTFENVTLSQATVLVMQDAAFAQAYENVDLSQANILAVSDSFYVFNIENLVLVVEGGPETDSLLLRMGCHMRNN